MTARKKIMPGQIFRRANEEAKKLVAWGAAVSLEDAPVIGPQSKPPDEIPESGKAPGTDPGEEDADPGSDAPDVSDRDPLTGLPTG